MTLSTRRLTFINYLAPMVVFGAFTSAEGWLPTGWYPVAYSVKLAAVVAALLGCRTSLRDIRPSWRDALPSVLLGLAVLVAWVAIDTLVPYPHLGDRVGFDPHVIGSAAGRAAFLTIRLFGLVVVVPVMEELLWRSFFLRYLTNARFLLVPIGTFTPLAFAWVLAGSAIAHPEWLVAVVANVAYGLWLRRTRSLFASVLAHATTNAGLGCYILATHAWQYW